MENAKELNQMYKCGYLAGLEDGIRRYAIWKDGEQRVGVMQKPLSQVLVDAMKEKVIVPFVDDVPGKFI